MKCSKIIFAFIFAGILTATAKAQTLSRESTLLAECEFIYIYTAQFMQLRSNTGAATNIIRRASVVIVANFMSNMEGDRVPTWKVKMWEDLRPALKANLENRKLDPLKEADRCDKDVMPIALRIRAQKQSLGQDFDSHQQKLMLQMKASLGL
jgi:hypothetical protein